jgi:hypothetical protein
MLNFVELMVQERHHLEFQSILDPYSFDTDPDPVWLQSFYDQKLEEKKLNQKPQFTYP